MGRRFLLVATLVVSGGLSAAGAQEVVSPPVHEVVIRGGRVLDGAGNPWIWADVAILVNGVVVIEPGGRHTGSLPGQGTVRSGDRTSYMTVEKRAPSLVLHRPTGT